MGGTERVGTVLRLQMVQLVQITMKSFIGPKTTRHN